MTIKLITTPLLSLAAGVVVVTGVAGGLLTTVAIHALTSFRLRILMMRAYQSAGSAPFETVSVPGQGFEPQFTDSESVVLPLDDPGV